MPIENSMKFIRYLRIYVQGFIIGFLHLTFSTCVNIAASPFYFATLAFLPRYHQRAMYYFASLWSWFHIGFTGMCIESMINVYIPQKGEPLREETLSAISERLSSGMITKSSKAPREIVISNHQIYLDWFFIWVFMRAIGSMGSLKIVLKKSMLNVPVLGYGMKILGFVPLERNWARDQISTSRRIKRLFRSGPKVPISLLYFPEGTVLSLETRGRSHNYALKNGWEPLENCLLPRSTGLKHILDNLANEFDGILDLTIGYDGIKKEDIPEDIFGMVSTYALFIGPPSVHIYARFYPMAQIPYQDKEEFSKWMYDIFREKDGLLEEFYRSGKFPGQTVKLFPMASFGDKLFAILCIAISQALLLWALRVFYALLVSI